MLSTEETMKLTILITALSFQLNALADTFYRATVNFGDHQYEDLLIVDKKLQGEIEFSGTFTVPGVFSSQIKGFLLKSSKLQVAFQGIATENGKTTPFRVVAEKKTTRISEPFIGNLFLGEPETQQADIILQYLFEETTP